MSEAQVTPEAEATEEKPVEIGGVEFVEKEFAQPGRAAKNAPIDPETKKPVTPKYKAKQLTETSISFEDGESFLDDVLESCDGDLGKARESFLIGWNRRERLSAGGYDEFQKAAKGIIKLAEDSGWTKMGWTKGLSVDEVAEKLKALEG